MAHPAEELHGPPVAVLIALEDGHLDRFAIDRQRLLGMRPFTAPGELQPEVLRAPELAGGPPGPFHVTVAEEDADELGRRADEEEAALPARRRLGEGPVSQQAQRRVPAFPSAADPSGERHQAPVTVERRRLREIRPEERQRLVEPPPALVLLGQEEAQSGVGPLRKGAHPSLRPVERAVVLPGLLVEPRDLQKTPGTGQIARLERHDRFEVARHPGEPFEDALDPEAVLRALPFRRLGQIPVDREPPRPEHLGIALDRAGERAQRRPHLPGEEPPRQLVGLGTHLLAGREVELPEVPEDHAHIAMGVVDFEESLLPEGERMLDEVERGLGMTALQEIPQHADRIAEPAGEAGDLPPRSDDVVAGPESLLQAATEGGKVRTPRPAALPRHLQSQPLAQPVVVDRLLEQDTGQKVPFLAAQKGTQTVEVQGLVLVPKLDLTVFWCGHASTGQYTPGAERRRTTDVGRGRSNVIR